MKSQRQLRILTGLVLGVLVLLVIFGLPSDFFFAVVLVLLTWAALELVGMLRHWAPQTPFGLFLGFLPVVTLGGAYVVRQGLTAPPAFVAAVFWAVLVLAGVLLVLWRSPIEEAAPALGFMAFALPYFAVPALCLYHLHRLDPWLVLLVVAIVAFGDSAAYFVGSAIGSHKMTPVVSPNKSWEGAIAGWLTALGTMVVWCLAHRGEVSPAWLVVAAVTAVAAQFGDLVESMIKRGAGVKDSAQVLPGHGGIYDRVDALLLAAPAFVLMLGSLGLTRQN